MSVKITKDNLMQILTDLGKEYKKQGGKNTPAEIIVTGGVAVLSQYSYRDSSYDMDAIIHASSALKDAANIVAEKYNLESDWLNSDFTKTVSYSRKLEEHSRYLTTRSNILTVRVVEPEYLLATKLKAGREYKHDLSDIVGIITEEKVKNANFSKENVMKAFYDMYGETSEPNEIAKELMEKAFATDEPEKLLEQTKIQEENASGLLKEFEKKYSNVLNDDNIHDILKEIRTQEFNKSDDLKNDKNIVLAVVSQNGLALETVSDELKDDKDVVLAAVRQNPESMQYASDELKDNTDFCIQVVMANPDAIKYVPEDIRESVSGAVKLRTDMDKQEMEVTKKEQTTDEQENSNTELERQEHDEPQEQNPSGDDDPEW
jgi:hypothetical protein